MFTKLMAQRHVGGTVWTHDLLHVPSTSQSVAATLSLQHVMMMARGLTDATGLTCTSLTEI